MPCEAEQVGVVVVMQKVMVSGLARLAVRRRWPLIHLQTATEVTRVIGRQKLDIAIVHVSVDPDQAVELVRWLRMTRQDILLIAVASAHREEAEWLVRNAGAHCYLPQADEAMLEQAIRGMLQQAAHQEE